MSKPLVSIVMGSDSDLEIMREAGKALDDFGIDYEIDVTSAHRSPDRTADYARNAAARGIRVIIAGAGDDHANAPSSRIAGVIGRPVRRPMRRSYVDLIVNSKIVKRFPSLAHDLEIGITAHHNRNQWLAHPSSAQSPYCQNF